jgi:hypothetical protein
VFDERTQAQIMADVFCDLLLTSNPTGHGATDQARSALGAIAPTVQVTVPATTLAGTTIGGAAVAGFGPIDDDTAKQLAGIAPGWVRVFTDPSTGVPISVDRYRPKRRQQLFLQVRDWQCRFPGCRRPVQKCDIDPPHAYSTHRCALRGASRRVGPRSRTRRVGPPACATWNTSANAITRSNTTPTGRWNNSAAASCGGPRPPAAPTSLDHRAR